MELNKFFNKTWEVNETGTQGFVAVGNKNGKENIWVNVNTLKNYLFEFYSKSNDKSLKKALELYIESL